MREMLGENEYGVITENSEEALYQGVKEMLTAPERLSHYKEGQGTGTPIFHGADGPGRRGDAG